MSTTRRTLDSISSWIYHSLEEESEWTTKEKHLRRTLYTTYADYCREMDGHYSRPVPVQRFYAQMTRILGVEKLGRTQVKLPEVEEMRKRMRRYLDDPAFPV